MERPGPSAVSQTEALRRAQAALRVAGRGGLVTLTGPLGSGRRYVAAQVAARLGLPSVCLSADLPGADLLTRLPKTPQEAAWVAAGLEPLAQNGAAGTSPEVAAALLARLVAAGPLLLVVEHLERADPRRAALWLALRRAAGRVRGVRLLFTATTPPEAGGLCLPLAPLTAPELAGLLRAALDGEAPGAAQTWLARRGGGHPLLTLEYLAWLRRTGALTRQGDGWRWQAPVAGAPGSLDALARALLPPDAPRAALTALAAHLLCPHVPEAEQRQVTGLTSAAWQTAVAWLTEAGLFVDGGPSPLAEAVPLLPLLPALLRARVAERAARRLAPSDAPAAARLVLQAGLEGLAWRPVLEAAARTRADHDPAEAGRWLAHAARLTPGPQAALLALEAARLLRADAPAEAEALAHQACTAPDPEVARAAWTLLAELTGARLPPEALAGLLAAAPPDWRAGLARHAGLAWFRQLRARGEVALALAVWARLPDAYAHADPDTRRSYAHCLLRAGRPDEAQAVLTQALAGELSPLDRGRLQNDLALTPLFQGDFAGAAVHLDRARLALRAAPRASALVQSNRLSVATNQALVHQGLGQPHVAVRLLRVAIAGWESLGRGLHAAQVAVYQGSVLSELGRFEAARTLLAEARGRLLDAGQPGLTVGHEVVLAWTYLYEGGPHAALALGHARAAHALCQRLKLHGDALQSLGLLALCEALLGDPARARRQARRNVRQAESAGVPRAAAFGWLALGLALERAGQDGAVAALERAVALLEGAGGVTDLQLCAAELARLRGDQAGLTAILARLAAQGNLGPLRFLRRGQAADVPSAQVQLEVLGPPRVRGPGGQLLRGPLARQALCALLEARLVGSEGLSADQLAEQLFPDQAPRTAQRRLVALIHRLRRALGPQVVRGWPGGYALGQVQSDAETFLAGGDLSLWRGPYRAGEPQDEGDVQARERLLAALEAQVRASLAGGQPALAAQGAALLCAEAPLDPRALGLWLRALDRLGQTRQAGRVYAAARRSFAEVGQVLPGRWTSFLTAEARQDAAPPTQLRGPGHAAREQGVARSTLYRRARRTGSPRGRPAKLDAVGRQRFQQALGEGAQRHGYPDDHWTLRRAAELLERLSGVRLSPAQVSRLLREFAA